MDIINKGKEAGTGFAQAGSRIVSANLLFRHIVSLQVTTGQNGRTGLTHT